MAKYRQELFSFSCQALKFAYCPDCSDGVTCYPSTRVQSHNTDFHGNGDNCGKPMLGSTVSRMACGKIGKR